MSNQKSVSVIADEVIASCLPFNNGAGPLWAFGSRVIVRENHDIWASVPEVDPAAKPLCNIRSTLMRRDADGHWQQVYRAETAAEREPCPLVRLPGGKIGLSIQPSIGVRSTGADGNEGHYCQPRLLVFDSVRSTEKPHAIVPQWDQPHQFTEHSYRALAADSQTGGLFLTNQLSFHPEHPHTWSFLDHDLRPLAQGQLHFPMRGCYQQAVVRGRAVYVMAISDEIEPVLDWRAYKKQVLQKDWDYEFRQLFFTWTPDITAIPFSPPLTVASHDETAGMIRNLDLVLDDQDDAWLLYLESNFYHAFFRDHFFPQTAIRVALRLARVRQGRVIERQTLVEANENRSATVPGGHDLDGVVFDTAIPKWASLHLDAGGRLWALWYQQGDDRTTGNYLCQIFPQRTATTRIPLDTPIETFQPACLRNGCLPTNTIDIYGLSDAEQTIRYVQLRLND